MRRYLGLIGLGLVALAVIGAILFGKQPLPVPVETTATEAPAPTATEPPAETELPASPTPDPWVVTVVEPACESAGYTRYENRLDGSVRVEEGAPALGHRFGAWRTDTETGAATRVCAVCGERQTRPSVESSLPRVELTGSLEGMGKVERVLLRMDYQDETRRFSCYAYTSWQGHSSMASEKKNYTIRLYNDDQLVEKNRMELRPGWQLEHKYILKANAWDVTQCRNLIGADVWASIVATRSGLNARLAETSHLGAVDGFPVSLRINGEFAGLYTLNLHKDDDLFGMREGARDAVLICNAQTMDEALFRADAVFEPEASDWEVEYCGTEDDAWARERFNALSRLLREADDETLRRELPGHLDVEAAEDYLLYIWALGLSRSGAKDLVLLCYDGGAWISSAYDMEEAFGLAADGSRALDPGDWLPGRGGDGLWRSGTDSLLFDRLVQAYGPELRLRWQALRQGPLSEESLVDIARARLNAVPDALIQADLLTYSQRTPLERPKEQILDYIHERLPLLDEALGGL